MSAWAHTLLCSQFPILGSCCCYPFPPSGTENSVTLHLLLCETHCSTVWWSIASRTCGSSWYVEGRRLWRTVLNIDSRSRRGQRSAHSFILCGHVLWQRDWDRCCVPIFTDCNSIQFVLQTKHNIQFLLVNIRIYFCTHSVEIWLRNPLLSIWLALMNQWYWLLGATERNLQSPVQVYWTCSLMMPFLSIFIWYWHINCLNYKTAFNTEKWTMIQ